MDAHTLRQAIKTLHTNLGHPENRALACAIRLTGGTDEAVKAAMEHQCTTCARLRTPMPVPPARISENIMHRNFNDYISLDTFALADYQGRTLILLCIIDNATLFQVVAPVDARHPDHILSKFLTHWVCTLGVPEAIKYDQGGEFEREYASEIEDMGSQLNPTAGASPTQNAVCERHNGIWTRHARSMIDDFSIQFTPEESRRVFWMTCMVN